MYPAPNNLNIVIMFCVVKWDQLDKPRLVTNHRLRHLAVYKKETPLPNIDKLIEVVPAYPGRSKLDMADGYFSIGVVKSSEICNTIQTIYSKMRSHVLLQGDRNASGKMMEVMLNIFKDIVYQCFVIYIDDIIIYSTTHEEQVRDLKKVLQQPEVQSSTCKKANVSSS